MERKHARRDTGAVTSICRCNTYDPGMVERLDDMPDGTVGFRIDGDVEREDYTEILVPALKAAVDSGRGLRALYLIEDLDDIEGEALWEDTKLGFDLAIKHHSDWRRSAIVTDIDWMARASKLFLWLFPGRPPLPGGRSRAGESVGAGLDPTA